LFELSFFPDDLEDDDPLLVVEDLELRPDDLEDDPWFVEF
jgi:hypothetical protein